eukprot:1968853-Amphidinium_carterae.1
MIPGTLSESSACHKGAEAIEFADSLNHRLTASTCHEGTEALQVPKHSSSQTLLIADPLRCSCHKGTEALKFADCLNRWALKHSDFLIADSLHCSRHKGTEALKLADSLNRRLTALLSAQGC